MKSILTLFLFFIPLVVHAGPERFEPPDLMFDEKGQAYAILRPHRDSELTDETKAMPVMIRFTNLGAVDTNFGKLGATALGKLHMVQNWGFQDTLVAWVEGAITTTGYRSWTSAKKIGATKSEPISEA